MVRVMFSALLAFVSVFACSVAVQAMPAKSGKQKEVLTIVADASPVTYLAYQDFTVLESFEYHEGKFEACMPPADKGSLTTGRYMEKCCLRFSQGRLNAMSEIRRHNLRSYATTLHRRDSAIVSRLYHLRC